MKKIFMVLTSLTLLVSLVLTGCDCSCNSTANLTFSNDFNNGNAPQMYYQEKLTYDVLYNGDGTDYPALKKLNSTDQYIEKDGIEFDGELVTTLKVINKVDFQNENPNVNSEVFTDDNVATGIYYYESVLNLNAKYTFKDEQVKEHTDKIITKVYFLPAGLQFAPIYSTYYADMHLFQLETAEKFVRVEYDYKTTYNLEEFTIDKLVKKYSDGDTAEPIVSSQVVNEEYEYKKVIDSNQFLFAVRNFATNSENSVIINAVSPAYNEAMPLALSPHTTNDYNINAFAKPEDASETVPVRNFTMNVGIQNASGSVQYLTVQTGKSTKDTLATSNALLVQYAQPIFDYSTSTCMGAIEFKLVNFEFTNA